MSHRPARPSARRRSTPLALAGLASALFAAACATAAREPEVTAARPIAPPADPCVLAREDARLDPRLDVERVPAPVKMDPAPIRTPVPREVLRRSSGTQIRAEVLVDTLGKADMATFAMLATPNAWYTTNLKAAVAKWTFEPALRNGCKVPRYYQFMVDLQARRR